MLRYDPTLVDLTHRSMYKCEGYSKWVELRRKGLYGAAVDDTVFLAKQKVQLVFRNMVSMGSAWSN